MAKCLVYAGRRFLATWAMALLVVGGFFTVLGLGPDLEPTLHPVLRDQSYRVLSYEGRRVEFDLRFYKARPCRIADVDWVLQRGEQTATVVVYRPDGSPVGPNASYAVGWTNIGPFYFDVPLRFPDPDLAYGVVYYDCHPGWLTRQILGPVRLQ